MPYRIAYSGDAQDHLRALTAGERARVFDKVDIQLRHQPTVATRHRKPLRPNPLALWELRIGHLRVFYNVVEEPEPVVDIRAVGIKRGNRVSIGGEVKEL